MIFAIQYFYFKAYILMLSHVPETGFCAAINPTDQILKCGMGNFGSISSHSVFQLTFLLIATSCFWKRKKANKTLKNRKVL